MDGFKFFSDGARVPEDYANFCSELFIDASEEECILTGEQLADELDRMILERP